MSTATELRAVTRGGGAAFTALISGSMVLAGKLCGCAGRVLVWAWDLASTDPEATAAAQAKADKEAKAKAGRAKKTGADGPESGDDGQGQDEEKEVTAPRVAPVRRPVLESVGMLALGGMLAAGAAGTAGALIAPHLELLTPWRPVIISVGGVGWMVAAWMLAPSPKPATDADEVQEQPADEAAEGELSPADLLARHVLAELAVLEREGRPGIHVTALLASAEERQLLAPGVMDKAAMRSWLDASGFPVTKSVKVQGSVDYGVRVDRLTKALGMGPTEALERAFGGAPAAPAETAPPAPVATPADAPDGAPAEAVAVAVPAPRLALVKPLPDGASPTSAHGAA
ncbi:hypothetical protein ACFVZR_38290 [Streptomyces sp. NPDC058316]|uniref:hypothetical protein n=1 Tax=Streptomyces sp. NPDC058316 TaxID=3346442 RepID=UPI0036EA5E8F